jgi:hypothetical protein
MCTIYMYIYISIRRDATTRSIYTSFYGKFALHLIFCWPCIIMYHNNVTNLIHFHFHKHFLVS